MNLLTQAVISGLMIGAVYAFLGIGLVLVYRTARILNLAHGESFAITGVAAAMLAKSGLPLGAALALAILIAVAFALSLHRFVLRPRAEWPAGTLILITLGAAFVVRGMLILVGGTDPVSFPALFSGAPLRIAGGVIPPQGIALVLLGFGGSTAVAVYLEMTRSGKQLLAAAENPYAAELLGVNVERARLTAYGIGALLGALAGALLIPLIAVDFQSGLAMTLRGFIAAAISGMSPIGVVFSGLGLGLFESWVGAYLGALYQDPVMFGLLIAVALWQSRHIRFGGTRRA
ncbi:MAG: branched-chain amino acid ABC transporter permease [Betaproteobacteria bacterium]|nr:branched-chain amino acid ABC transporter permease [Betaproteobacteria bacterium]